MSDWSKYKEKVRNTNPEISKDIDEVEEISSIRIKFYCSAIHKDG